jgi:hypothetical protein
MYLSYDEYKDYGGTLEETTYNKFVFEAESIVDYYTFNRLKNDTVISEPVKRLVFALIEVAAKKEATLALGVSSSNPGSAGDVYITRQANDGVDTTYNSMSASTLYQLCRQETSKLIQRYLSQVINQAGQKVLYRGLYPGE